MRLLSTVAAGLLAASSILSVAAAAPAIDQAAMPQATTGFAPIVEAQFIFGGHNYCWYPRGWHGPGWYWCGYAFRHGFGWGGPVGWHGWRAGHPTHGGRPGGHGGHPTHGGGGHGHHH